MKSLKQRWIEALNNPLYLALVLLVVIVAFWTCSAEGAGFEITVENTTDKTAVITIMTPAENDVVYKIAPRSDRNISMNYGEYFICVGLERNIHGEMMADVHKCYPIEITEENLYDEDGDKMYWEISE